MRTSSLRQYSLPLVLAIILAGLFSAMSSCGGGGGGGGGGLPAPFIYAELISLPTGSSLPGYKGAFVYVLDDDTGAPVTNAMVTINGVTLSFVAADEAYEGDVIVDPGANVILNVNAGGRSYSVAGTQLSSYPVIDDPASGDSWKASLPHAIEWSGDYPATITLLGVGVMDADDPEGALLWPSSGYLQEILSSETSYTVPAGGLTSERDRVNALVCVVAGKEIPIPNAAPDSSFLIGGFNYVPVTVTGPTTLVSDILYPSGIAVDSTSVYWTNIDAYRIDDQGYIYSEGSINKVDKNGGTVTTLTSSIRDPGRIAIDSADVYLAASGGVSKVGINGGAVSILAAGIYSPSDIVVDSNNVYWTESWSLAGAAGNARKIGINGGTATTYDSNNRSPSGIAVDSDSVYWTSYYNWDWGCIKKIGINGDYTTALVVGLGGEKPQDIAVDSTSVYWTDAGLGTVSKVGKTGGAVTVLASGLLNPIGIATDATSVYWTDAYAGTVSKVGLDGGTVTVLAAGLSGPSNIAIDSDSVYWTESGAIRKIAK